MSTKAASLAGLPVEVRLKIIHFALPGEFRIQLDLTSSSFTHEPTPLLAVSRTIRAETLFYLQREIMVTISSPAPILHQLDPPLAGPPRTPFFDGCPRQLRFTVLAPLSEHITTLTSAHDREQATCRPEIDKFLVRWGNALVRLPESTRRVDLDFSHDGFEVRPVVLSHLVQRVATRLWISSRGKTIVTVSGCKTPNGQRFLENCIIGHKGVQVDFDKVGTDT
ncbi:hypothetical protein ASPZODRAFT_904604 [Penicilliopsis zonata CBS 506.65]|uniref:F-box domain-containing protein n=1 Tax=Penicilliopsis zonata CBS 506.65 TaxID=1073090 RepID=A0A1L9S908_9EURO|nr:hypothetical protein ASPZODRAFT_904604 [Penicilliopsis zonata CBS 506.65]OJJ43634.1 hypothetical protein ASPZODRAFT_904604 [Penicilliopsis zonata CBS 506.65]